MTTKTDDNKTDEGSEQLESGKQGEDEEVEGQQDGHDTAAEAEEAEAGFTTGFNRIAKKDDPDAQDGKDDKSTDAGAAAGKPAADDAGAKKDDGAAAAAAAAAPAKDPWEGVPTIVRERLEALGDVPQQLRKLAGSIGGLNSKLDSAVATAKAAAERKGGDGAAPSDSQVKAAMADPEAWKQLEADYPDWAGPMKKELEALHAAVAKRGEGGSVDMNAFNEKLEKSVSAAVDEAEERAYVRLKHPDYKTVAKSPEFHAWFKSQPADFQGKAASKLADDAIAVFDAYKAHTEQQRKAAEEREKKERRMAGAVTPRGGAATAGVTVLPDEAGFENGFKKVANKR